MTDLHQAFDDVIARYSGVDIAIDDEDVPWIPTEDYDNTYVKPLRFDVTNGVMISITWASGPAVVGRHRHHGLVLGYTLEGTWSYKERDWVAKPGTFVIEPPGVVHTLQTDNPTGFKTLFIEPATSDFFDDDGETTGVTSVFWLIDLYEKYCAANGLEIDKRLFV